MITIGCDPELMLVDSKGNLKSAIPVLNGSKAEPRKVKCGAYLSDNVNLEFNTDPAKTSKEFVNVIGTVLKECVKVVDSKKLKLVANSSADFPASELKDKRAQEFGCEPDFDAWTVSMNEVGADAAKNSFRSCGGHIHIGMTDKTKWLDDFDGKIRMVKGMDLICGIPSVILDKDPSSPARRKLYGKAGSHRPKSYGVEYRALGNFWVKSPELVELIYYLTNDAVKLVHENKEAELVGKIGEEKVIDIINNSKLKEAEKAFSQYIQHYLSPKSLELFNKNLGIDYDLYTAWGL